MVVSLNIKYYDRTKYFKLSKEWETEKVNMKRNKEDDQIFRLAVGSKSSFFDSLLYNYKISNTNLNTREDKLKSLYKKNFCINKNTFLSFFFYHKYQYIKYWFNFLQDFSFLEEVNQKNNKIIKIIHELLKDRNEDFCEVLERKIHEEDIFQCNIPYKNIEFIYSKLENIFNTVFKEYISFNEHFDLIQDHNYSNDTIDEYKTLLITNFIDISNKIIDKMLHDYTHDNEEFTLNDFFYSYQHLNTDCNLLIFEKNLDNNEPIFKLANDKKLNQTLFFDKEKVKSIILLYFPESNNFERLYFDSYHHPNKLEINNDYQIKSTNKNKSIFRSYVFPQEHQILSNMFQN